MSIRTAIIDDNHFLIKSLQEKLSLFPDITISFTANDGLQCMDKLNQDPQVDLMLMDLEMPVKNGIEATAAVKQRCPDLKVIILTVFDDDENIFNAIQAGADGYLLKETGAHELHNAMVQTLNGGAIMTPSIALKALNLLRSPLAPTVAHMEESVQLSNREVEVLEQLSTGIPYTAIAEKLFISPFTVRKHIENIYKKLQVNSKVMAIEKAKRNGLI
ncbi:response regulator transcription factor [Maribacter flavus]|uniref:Response regulator transcription factor n=1 Tax=Maribacter flavus TaxID=1658664 RepID=A0A5B2TXW5_9FLAO|nr:response regulator transcription factor [Maribacter flavus]KAA2219003.1 response regulator transcription factor [Maribacter flavus]